MTRFNTPLILALLFVSPSCTPSDAVRALSTADAVGRATARVLGWCEDNGVSFEDVARAQKALEEKRYAEAAALSAKLVDAARSAGADVPEEIAVLAALAKGAAVAEAIDQGMSAISQ